jgi:hypothetical protein
VQARQRRDGVGRASPCLVLIGKFCNGVSAAFIKELMRRIAQASIARDGGTSVESGDISEALDDMLFAGGKLNVKLLGGAQAMVEG